MLNALCLWYRKCYDTFAIKSHDLGETLQKVNDIDGKGIRRKFTITELHDNFKCKERNNNRYIENQLTQVGIPISHQINQCM